MGRYCPQCGTLNSDTAKFCYTCGKPLQVPQPSSGPQVGLSDTIATRVTDFTNTASRTLDNLRNTVTGGNVKGPKTGNASNWSDSGRYPGGGGVSRIYTEDGREIHISPEGESTIIGDPNTWERARRRRTCFSEDELWTWLKKDDHRQLFYQPGGVGVSEDGYMNLLRRKIEENRVPARIVQKTIEWDGSRVEDTLYFVEPETQAVNPLSCYLKFAQVGDFSFVEQKTFFAPPNLPEVPEKKVPEHKLATVAGLIGIALLIAAIFVNRTLGYYVEGAWMYPGFAGALFLAFFIVSYMRAVDARSHNEKVDRQIAGWDKAWDRWEAEAFVHSFQEATNGQVTRIYQSVFDCIRQVDEELFSRAEKTEQHEESKMSELEAQIARRRDAYR